MKLTHVNDCRQTAWHKHREIRDERLTSREVLSVPCPRPLCAAQVGEGCRTDTNYGARTHAPRVKAAGARFDRGEPEAIRHKIRAGGLTWSSYVPKKASEIMRAQGGTHEVEIEHVLFSFTKAVRLLVDGETVLEWED